MENVLSRRKLKHFGHFQRKGKHQTSESSKQEERRTQNEPEDDEPSTWTRNDSLEKGITIREMMMISEMVRVSQLKDLIIQLDLDDQTMNEIEETCNQRMLPFKELVFRALREWKHRNGRKATRNVLKRALLAMKRNDVAHAVFPHILEPGDRKQMQEHYKGIQRRLEEGQRERYQRIELPQVNWTNRDLPLEELYVDIELIGSSDDGDESKGQNIPLEEIFREINGKKPLRILIEGGPGYGKTTLCAKLLSDWGQRKIYISSKFKMVFLFEMRYFKHTDSIESVLKRECEAVGVYEGHGIRCIEAFEGETLLILDGFDEMNEECKMIFIPLFQKNVYRSMFVLVTSRTGLFQVEIKKGSKHLGLLEKKNEIENIVDVWGKRVLIKGVTTDKIEAFMRKYFQKDYQGLEGKINSITGGEMREVFQCPLFLILLAMMLEERQLVTINTKTTLYKEFFNFVVRRNLIREKKLSDEEELDIFDGSSEHYAVQLLQKFGRFAIKCLYENKLLCEEKEILSYCEDETIFKLGLLTKVLKTEGRKRGNFYQPIHKNFLVFVAAFAMWNLFKTEENEFKQEMKRIGEKGLKPTNDSLFYVFLGGLMNSQASVLFRSLIHYRSWFNIENLCFTNILLEIQDVHSFFPSFQSILDLFIPSHYSIPGVKGLTSDYFLSDIHSLILKHASDRQLIKVLDWDSNFFINLSRELSFDCLKFNLTDEVFKFSSKEKRISIKCKNIIYRLTKFYKANQWNDIVSLINAIQREHIHFFFDSESKEINSYLLNLLHEELIKGRLKQKKIDRLRFKLNEGDNPRSVSLLVDLVKKKKINEGIYLHVNSLGGITEIETYFRNSKTEELFNSIFKSTAIKEFIVDYSDCYFSPDIHVTRSQNSQLKRIHFSGRLKLLNSNESKPEKYFFEEVHMTSVDDENNFNFIQNLQGIKYLCCKSICFSSLVEMKWPELKVIEELKLDKIEHLSPHLFLNSLSQLRNVRVLSLNVFLIETVISNSDQCLFIDFFSSLYLKICEFLSIRNHELFSFLTEVLMEGMKKKEREGENKLTIDSNEGKKVYLQELVIGMNYYKLNQCNGIRWIQTMLKDQHLKQCFFFNDYYSNVIESDVVESLFPSKDKFRISREVDGMTPNNSRRSQFDYRWFSFHDSCCIKYMNK